MKRKSKWVLWGFLSLDYKAIQFYLEEMAAKGWMLEKVNRMFAKFVSIEPKELKFCVDVFKKGGPLTPENTKEAEAYRALCKETGWHFITSLDYLQYFYADRNEDITPIQTDEALEQKIVASTLWRSELIGMILFMLIAGMAIVLHYPIKYKNLLDYTGVFGTYVFPVLFLITFLSSIYNLSWIFSARRSVKNGYSLRIPSLKAAKQRALAINIPVLIIMIILVTALLLDASISPREVMGTIFAPFLGVSVGLGLRYMIKKKASEKKDGILYMAIAFIVIVAVMALESRSSIVYTEEDYNRIVTIPNGYPSLDLGQIEVQGTIARSVFSAGKSPVVPKHYNYSESRMIDDTEMRVVVNYYRAYNARFATIIFDGINDELSKGIKWRGAHYFEKVMGPDEAMQTSWEMDDLSISEERDEIVIRKGNTVVHMYGKLDFENEDLRNRIINDLFSAE